MIMVGVRVREYGSDGRTGNKEEWAYAEPLSSEDCARSPSRDWRFRSLTKLGGRGLERQGTRRLDLELEDVVLHDSEGLDGDVG
jgi:hypothetical protein